MIERRFSKGAEVRAADTGVLNGVVVDGPRIEGYAAVYGEDFVLYEDSAFKVTETIAPGAFSDVLKDDVRCLFNHDADHVLGRTTNGTLNMADDSKGLFYTNQMDPNTRIGKDVYSYIRRGDVTGCSFAFIVGDATYTETVNGNRTEIVRTINKLSNLYDVGPVTYPAYPQTSIDARLEQRSALAGLPEELKTRIQAGKPARTLGESNPLLAAHTDYITRD